MITRPSLSAAPVGVLLAALLVAACGDDGAPPATPGPRAPGAPVVALPGTLPHQADVALGPTLVTADTDEGCGSCHAEVVAAYATNGMHNALTLPSGAGSPEAAHVGADIVHERTGMRVRFDALDGRYVQTLLYVDPGGVERVRYHMPADLVIGSGAASRGYLGVAGDALFVLPLGWFRELDGLALSPGPGFETFATRAVPILCLQCHTGDARPADPRTAFGFTGSISLGVGCSRCHGDGAAHSETGDPRDIVNPARLDVERQSELCYQCHFGGAEHLFAPGKDLSQHVPDRPLAETMAVFVPADGWDDSGAAIAGHVVRLHRSKCFTESQDMTCSTCHNPHPRPGADAEGCGICHSVQSSAGTGDVSAGEPGATTGAGTGAASRVGGCAESHGARADRRCASCHMARVGSSDIEHTTTTDHWIRRRPEPPARADQRPEDRRVGAHALRNAELINVLDPQGLQPHAALLQAQAYLAGVEEANTLFSAPAPQYLGRAAALLDELLARTPDDVDVLVLRARAHRLSGKPYPGVALLGRALELVPAHPLAVRERGLTALALDDVEGAKTWLTQAYGYVPDDLILVHALSLAYERGGDPRRAVEALGLARKRGGPRLDLAHLGVGLALRHGLLAEALSFAFDRLAFRPRDPGALAETGEILRALGRGAEARPFFEAALGFDARAVPALIGLAELERAGGNARRAAELFDTARRLAPDHPAFRQR